MGQRLGLTAHDLGDMGRLMQLAVNPQDNARGEIYLAVASLYRTQGPLLSERERGLMREILQRLALDVEMAIRISLAERLADDPTAPLDLILLLCDDRIEVARPIILRSRRLSDDDIIALIERADVPVQTACAERPNIGEAVTEVLANSDAEPVLTALLRNVTARIAPGTFETLAQKSRHIVSLQHPLAHRADLPNAIALQMCEWVSEALKQHISHAFPADAASTETRIDQAAKAIQEPQSATTNSSLDSARKLVDKLSAAGQLRAGFLLRVLHQSQMDLFETAFAKLLSMDIPTVRHVLYQRGPRAVAMACRAVGIDKCVFATVYNLSRQARGEKANLSADDKADVEAVFAGFTKAEALARLHTPSAA